VGGWGGGGSDDDYWLSVSTSTPVSLNTFLQSKSPTTGAVLSPGPGKTIVLKSQLATQFTT